MTKNKPAGKPSLTINDIRIVAKEHGYDPAFIHAIGQVEGTGRGFYDDGHPIVLFERHIMYDLLKKKHGQAFADKHASQSPIIVNKARTPAGQYGTEQVQRVRLEQAALIDRECALQACSWGRFQVLGKWWQLLGAYESLQDFVNQMYRSEKDHLDAMIEFCKNVAPSAGQAIKTKNFLAFALAYNGKSQQGYDKRIQAQYAKSKVLF